MWMIKMRSRGIAIPKSRLFERSSSFYEGNCSVLEAQDIYTRRTRTMARFACNGITDFSHVLLDARLIWFEEDKFMLSGIERIQDGPVQIEYAQSWLVAVEAFNSANRMKESARSGVSSRAVDA